MKIFVNKKNCVDCLTQSLLAEMALMARVGLVKRKCCLNRPGCDKCVSDLVVSNFCCKLYCSFSLCAHIYFFFVSDVHVQSVALAGFINHA